MILTLALALLLAPRAGSPPIFVDKGACPFECCTYGEWTARRTVHVVEQPAVSAPIVGTVSAGTNVRALTGHVVTRAGRFRVKRAHGLYKPGDVLFVYTYLGEGYFKVWFGGRFYDEELGFSPGGGTDGSRCDKSADCWGTLQAEHQSTWWVQLLLSDGRSAWTRESHSFTGKDSCG